MKAAQVDKRFNAIATLSMFNSGECVATGRRFKFCLRDLKGSEFLRFRRRSACCQCHRLRFANAARCLARELEAPMTLTFAEFVIVWLLVCGVFWTLILRVMASNGTRLR